MAVSGNLGGKVPIVDDVLSSHEQEIYPTTSLDKNCIEFEFQTDRNFYSVLRQPFLAMKLKFFKGRGYDTYDSKEKKKEHKDESVCFTETGTDDEEEQEVARVTYVNNITQMFQMLKCTLTIGRFTIPMDSLHTNLTFQTTLRQPFTNTRKFCIVKAMTMNRILRILVTPYLILFFTRRMKLLSRPDGFMLYGELGIDFFSTDELLYPNMKIILRLIRARPNFYIVSDNPKVSLGIVDCSFYTRRIALKDDYHKKKKGRARLCSCRIQLIGDFGKDIHHTWETKPIHSRKTFNTAPIRRVAIAMNANSAFTGYLTENPFRC